MSASNSNGSEKKDEPVIELVDSEPEQSGEEFVAPPRKEKGSKPSKSKRKLDKGGKKEGPPKKKAKSDGYEVYNPKGIPGLGRSITIKEKVGSVLIENGVANPLWVKKLADGSWCVIDWGTNEVLWSGMGVKPDP